MTKHLCASLLVLAALAGCSSESITSSEPAAYVLSSRPDMVSGNDTLIGVSGKAGDLKAVYLNGQKITSAFTRQEGGDYTGLVTGLVPGQNDIDVFYGSKRSTLKVINHSSGGPVFAGPQPGPWKCQEGALDDKCNQAPTYNFWYLSTNPATPDFQRYDPAAPATDVATTTTENGDVLPFIVREEVGYIDRDQYRIAVLMDPTKAWSAAVPQGQFNHKVLVTHGFGCGAAYQPAQSPAVINYQPVDARNTSNGAVPFTPNEVVPDTAKYALGKGFAVMSSALDNSSHNCNLAIQAEALMMVKERLVEQLGTVRYTIGIGCSGGSLAQQWVANAYPGIYQGVLPTCSFPDAWTSATQVFDYHILNAFFGPAFTGLPGGRASSPWTETQVASVMGSPAVVNSYTSDTGFYYAIVPSTVCAGTDSSSVYNKDTNPGGTRCSIGDLSINLLGVRGSSAWGAAEKKIGRGFADLPVDNVGVQYGLKTLQDGLITLDMFLDLNKNIGGVDVDGDLIADRTKASIPSLENAYRSGLINTTSNYNNIAVIDCRGPDPGAAHDAYRTYAVRARLDKVHGNHDNHIVFEGPYPLGADSDCQQNSFVMMDQWLSNAEKDATSDPLSKKLTRAKPADLTDSCYNGSGVKLSNTLCGDTVVMSYATPRIVSGDSITTLNNKCQLRPLSRADNYGPIPMTDAQFAALQSIFPEGVCDFSKPAVAEQGTVPWLIYQDSSGRVVYGGKSLPKVSAVHGSGLQSKAFQHLWPTF